LNCIWGACRKWSDWPARADWTLPVGLIAGVFAAHQFSGLPPSWLLYGAALAGLTLAYRAEFRCLAMMILACCWALWQFGQGLDQRLDDSLIGEVMLVEGMVSGIPEVHDDYTRFRFEPLSNKAQKKLPETLLVYWYRERPAVSVGERWSLELQLKPPWGRVNFTGPDREKWLFSEAVGGLGTVREGWLLAHPAGLQYPVQRVRNQVRKSLVSLIDDARARAVVQALSIAERSAVSPKDRQLLMATGTSHLLAISGLHIGLAAVGGAWLGRLFFILLPFSLFRRAGMRTALICGVAAALSYAALAGWGVSTQRAVLMICVAAAALILRRSISASRAYLLALALVLMLDPLAPLGAGFWFSFLAVAVLLILFSPSGNRTSLLKTALVAQAGVMVAMLPLSAYWFQAFSPVGFLANLVAIPWVSLIVVPLILAGISLLPVWTEFAGLLLALSGKASLILLAFLEFLSGLQGAMPILQSPSVPVLWLATLGGLLLLLPRALSLRCFGLFLMLPLFLPPGARAERGSLLVEALDTGQGTAVLVSTDKRSLLYDSGPGDGQGQDLVRSVIVPALARLGRSAPERIVISHGDLDHAGGIGGLATHYPDARWNVNIPGHRWKNAPCLEGLNWNWSGFEFEVLHPSPGLPYLGNDSSCVLRVAGSSASVLLAGDVSSAVESRLLAANPGRHRVLIVPHHGSMTSSSEEFIAMVQPEIAIATTGLGNRFGFPREEIRQRYLSAGSHFWSTDACGALRVRIAGDGSIQSASARRERKAIWRWPAAADCP
jgi:competence protein ComEC